MSKSTPGAGSTRGRLFVGLMSGTSADGIDAVVCRIVGRGLRMRPSILAHVERPYPADVRADVLAAASGAAGSATGFTRLNWRLGRLFAQAAAQAMRKAGVDGRAVCAVGSHGQTICHVPRGAGPSAPPGTWQIGEPALIARTVGAPVVARFREADVAAGGQGAPLVPWTDYVLFRHARRGRILQNIGGIANATYIPAGSSSSHGSAERTAAGGPDVVRAFDVGPGNMVIDGLMRRLTGGRLSFDRNGRLAARGSICLPLLAEWLRHPFFRRRPPKSCGREEFGDPFVEFALRRYRKRLTDADLVATATMLTVQSLLDAYRRFLPRRPGRPPADEVILCGGGARNATLRAMLAEALTGIAVRTIDEYGIAVQAKEALSFAMLAAACVDGVPSNLPAVTGARRAVVLGQIVPA